MKKSNGYKPNSPFLVKAVQDEVSLIVNDVVVNGKPEVVNDKCSVVNGKLEVVNDKCSVVNGKPEVVNGSAAPVNNTDTVVSKI